MVCRYPAGQASVLMLAQPLARRHFLVRASEKRLSWATKRMERLIYLFFLALTALLADNEDNYAL